MNPCPKPAPKEKKPRRPLPRASKPIPKSTKPIPKVNLKALAKRRKTYRTKHLGKEYRAVRKLAMIRAMGQCELAGVDPATRSAWRCEETERLEFHHLRYPKHRALEVTDGVILCRFHHHSLELTNHSHRHTKNRTYGTSTGPKAL